MTRRRWQACASLLASDVEFTLVNFSDIDRVSHGAGPHSTAAAETRRASDAVVRDLLAFLRERDDWPRTTVVITADHGFDTIRHPALAFGAVAADAGLTDIVSVGDGGVGHVYLRSSMPGEGSEAQLAAARRLALATPGIAEALYLTPNAADGGAAFTLAAMHADWHLVHPRGGDLLLVAAPGNVLSDGWRRGQAAGQSRCSRRDPCAGDRRPGRTSCDRRLWHHHCRRPRADVLVVPRAARRRAPRRWCDSPHRTRSHPVRRVPLTRPAEGVTQS